jgi:hypothetical protein
MMPTTLTANGDVQIKMTAGKMVAMYATSERLVVLRVVSPEEAEIAYDGPGQPAWEKTGKSAKNGQRVISLARLPRHGSKRPPDFKHSRSVRRL